MTDIKKTRKENGLCRWCGEPVAKTSITFCEKHLAANRKTSLKNRTKYSQLKSNARNRIIAFSLKKDQFDEWYSSSKQCYYCGITLDELKRVTNKKAFLTVDRKNNALGYEPNNVCVACHRCNHMKGCFFTESEWLEIVEKYVLPRRNEYHRWGNVRPAYLR